VALLPGQRALGTVGWKEKVVEFGLGFVLLKLLKGAVGIPRGAAGDLEVKGRGGRPHLEKAPTSWRHKRATGKPCKIHNVADLRR
jgi:hypothetical protein